MTKLKHSLPTALLSLLILWVVSLASLTPDGSLSAGERRPLRQFPVFSAQSVHSGRFMDDLESYLQDQFPFRETLRSLKAVVILEVFRLTDHHGITRYEGHAVKLPQPLDEERIRRVTGIFQKLATNQLQASQGRVRFALIPDKSHYLPAGQIPQLDQAKLAELLRAELPGFDFVDLSGQLTLDDFYTTDPHWRQVALTGIAATLAPKGEQPGQEDLRPEVLPRLFFGAWQGQAALAMPGDSLVYLTGPSLDRVRVLDHETGQWQGIYDLEAALTRDPYDLFLSGARPLLTLENPGQPDGELVVFRDSFASSLIPLLIGHYHRITLIDIRYLAPSRLDQFVQLDGPDVLFLYSAATLNEGIFLE